MNWLLAFNSKLKDDRRFRLLLLLSCVLLICLRQPALLLHPRLWAEEGCVFYEFARHHSVYAVFTTVHVGYLTLFNSIVSAVQANFLRVEDVAILSTWMGLCVQLIPLYIIAYTTHEFWNTALKKMLTAFMFVLVAAPELWLNTTNSHFIFGLITFLILIVSAVDLKRGQKYFFRILLVMGGLTGPASMFFTPVFLLKARREKSREKYIQAAILFTCACIQAFIIVYCILYNNKYSRLGEHSMAKTVHAFFTDNFSLNFYIDRMQANFYFGLVVACFFVYLCFKHLKKNGYWIFTSSFLLIAVFSTLGSLNMAGSPRYGYVPTCILVVLLLQEVYASFAQKNFSRYLAPALFAFCLLVNSVCYLRAMHLVYSSSFPIWKEEVASWRADTTNYPRVHPGHGIRVRP